MNGVLGKLNTQSAQNQVVYTVPANADYATVSVNFCNKGPSDAKLRVAITTNASNPAAEDYIEFDVVLTANGGTLERTCMLMSANEMIIVYTDQPNVSVRVSGLEEITTV